jgi:hypothetical protein
MEGLIKMETTHKNHNTKIEVDNGTEFKDFRVEVSDGTRIHSIHAQSFVEDDVEVLEMGKIKLRGRELEMFKEFLNQ